MPHSTLLEASAVARLIGHDGTTTIGWLYHWNNGELSLLWLERSRQVRELDPLPTGELLALVCADPSISKSLTNAIPASVLETLKREEKFGEQGH